MKERPILFKGPEVRAIIEGRKTMTRRVVKPQPRQGTPYGVARAAECPGDWTWANKGGISFTISNNPSGPDGWAERNSCFGSPGDRLWVRESLYLDIDRGWQYADTSPLQCPHDRVGEMVRWLTERPAKQGSCPSIQMPRWASRVTLEVVAVRVERLQEISNLDLLAEGWPAAAEVASGCEGPEAFPFQGVTRGDLLRGGVENPDTAVEWFADEWDSLYGEGSWAANPWVWVVEFRRVEDG